MMRIILSKQALESLQGLSSFDRSTVADAIDRLQAGSERGVSVDGRLVSPTTSRSYFRYRVSSKLRIVFAIEQAQRAIYIVDIAKKWSGPSGVPREQVQGLTAKVFIASSVEGLDIAYAIQENLEHDAEVTIWTQGVFEPSDQIVPRLLAVLDRTDFGIFVFSPDDMTKLRKAELQTVRDNVVLELGLFVGRLGHQRIFMITPKAGPRFHVPSDLLGLVILEYDASREDGSLAAALGPACSKIRRTLGEVGLVARPSTRPTDDEDATRSEDSPHKTLWARSMPQLDLVPETKVAELHAVLERICQRTCERVSQIHPGVTPADFRVHVILPDYSRFDELGTYQLFLAKDLRVGDHGTDEALTLWAGQGVAGRAFQRQALEKVRIGSGPDGVPVWPVGYEFTETYKRSMPADLRWLVAIPLRVPRSDQKLETKGVLSIQGLKYELTDDQLDAVIGFSLSYVMVAAALISGLSSHVGVSEKPAELPPGENLLSEVTFEHLTDLERKAMLDVWFENAQLLVDSRDPEAKHQAGIELAKRYLKT